MKEPKHYKFKTIVDIIEALDEKNIDNFLKDFSAFLHFRLGIKVLAKATGGDIAGDDFFHWIDDGKNNVKITIKVQKEKP